MLVPPEVTSHAKQKNSSSQNVDSQINSIVSYGGDTQTLINGAAIKSFAELYGNYPTIRKPSAIKRLWDIITNLFKTSDAIHNSAKNNLDVN